MVTAPAVTSCVTVRVWRCAVVPAPNMYPEKKDVITSKTIVAHLEPVKICGRTTNMSPSLPWTALVSLRSNRRAAVLIACLPRILSLPCCHPGHPSADPLPLCHEGCTYLLCNVVTPVLCVFCSLCVPQHCSASVTIDSSVKKDTSEEDGMQ